MAIENTHDRGASRFASYITFRLGDEHFALDVANVREVLDLTPITRLPHAPPHLSGVVNVRGTAIPVVDLRSKFGLPLTAHSVHTRVIVVEVELEGKSCLLGGLADAVQEVIDLDDRQITPPPTTGLRWRSELIHGIARHGERFIIVFDTPKLFASDEVAVAASANHAA